MTYASLYVLEQHPPAARSARFCCLLPKVSPPRRLRQSARPCADCAAISPAINSSARFSTVRRLGLRKACHDFVFSVRPISPISSAAWLSTPPGAHRTRTAVVSAIDRPCLAVVRYSLLATSSMASRSLGIERKVTRHTPRAVPRIHQPSMFALRTVQRINPRPGRPAGQIARVPLPARPARPGTGKVSFREIRVKFVGKADRP